MNGSFIRSIAILSGSNLAAQVINFITYLILPKYFYDPEEFGVFGLFLALYFILFEVINLKMDQSVMLPESERDSLGLLGFSWAVAGVLSLLAAALLWGLNTVFGWLPAWMPLVIGGSLLLGGVMQPAMVYLNRKGSYVRMGNIRILQAAVTLIASVAAWYWLTAGNGLIAGFFCGQAAAVAVTLFIVQSPEIHIASRQVIDRYNQFIRYGSLSAMVSTLSRHLPVFVLKPVFGDAALGWYTLAVKYLNAPIGIFSVSVGQVYFRDASRMDAPELRRLTRSVVVNILALAVLPSIIILLFGGGLFEWIFGPEWRGAGQVMQVLILWYFIAYASGPVSMLLDIKLKLDWELTYNVLLLTGRALALLSAIWWKDICIVLGVYTAVGVIFNAILLNYVLKLSGKPA